LQRHRVVWSVFSTAAHKLLKKRTNPRFPHPTCWYVNSISPATRRYASTLFCFSLAPFHANPAQQNQRIWRVLHREPTMNGRRDCRPRRKALRSNKTRTRHHAYRRNRSQWCHRPGDRYPSTCRRPQRHWGRPSA
jgi:hypothetical protein